MTKILNSIFWHAPKALKVESSDAHAAEKLKGALEGLVADPLSRGQTLVALCIGTDRSTGDSLGPIIGSALKRRLPYIPLYGTLDNPVHALNLVDTMKDVEGLHQNSFILAVDACLGKLDSVGKIDVGPGPLKPGAGVHKALPPVGDAHISGIVNVGGVLEYFVLQNTRLHTVMTLAEIITEGLHHIFANCLEMDRAGVR